MAAKKTTAVIPVFTGRNVTLPEIVQASGIGKATIKHGLRDGVLSAYVGFVLGISSPPFFPNFRLLPDNNIIA